MSGQWVSETIQINDDTSVDVTADVERVVLGQHGNAWIEDLHLQGAQAIALGCALIRGGLHSLQAQLDARA